MSSRSKDAIKLLLGITCLAGFIAAVFNICEYKLSLVEIASSDGRQPVASSDFAALRGFLDPQVALKRCSS